MLSTISNACMPMYFFVFKSYKPFFTDRSVDHFTVSWRFVTQTHVSLQCLMILAELNETLSSTHTPLWQPLILLKLKAASLSRPDPTLSFQLLHFAKQLGSNNESSVRRIPGRDENRLWIMDVIHLFPESYPSPGAFSSFITGPRSTASMNWSVCKETWNPIMLSRFALKVTQMPVSFPWILSLPGTEWTITRSSKQKQRWWYFWLLSEIKWNVLTGFLWQILQMLQIWHLIFETTSSSFREVLLLRLLEPVSSCMLCFCCCCCFLRHNTSSGSSQRADAETSSFMRDAGMFSDMLVLLITEQTEITHCCDFLRRWRQRKHAAAQRLSETRRLSVTTLKGLSFSHYWTGLTGIQMIWCDLSAFHLLKHACSLL